MLYCVDQLFTNHKLSIISRDQLSTNHKPSDTSRGRLSTNHKSSTVSRDQLSTNHIEVYDGAIVNNSGPNCKTRGRAEELK